MIIANYDVRKTLVDNGSSIDVLLYDTFFRMRLPPNKLKWINASLVRFFKDSVATGGEVIF